MELASRLPEVFGDPPRPRITLHVARGYDDEWQLSEERVAELAALDEEQHWTEVSAEATQQFQEYFAFSDAEGWRFYLPAFLRHYLADFPLSQWPAVDWACAERTHFELFTPPQIACTVKGGVAHVRFQSGYDDSGGRGEAVLTLRGNKLEWKITKSSGAHYLPTSSVLDRQKKRETKSPHHAMQRLMDHAPVRSVRLASGRARTRNREQYLHRLSRPLGQEGVSSVHQHD